MLKPAFTKQFKKDIARAQRRGKDTQKIRDIMERLVNEEPLEEKYKDHKLIGNYAGRRECHIEPNWLLIYKLTPEEIIFERNGTHSDLFKK